MKYLNLIWYGPYFIVSLLWGLACIFVKHHLEHWCYAYFHRDEVELIKAAKKASATMKHQDGHSASTYQCSGCVAGWCDGCSPL